MANFFFYGTLCHLPLLELVLNRALSEDDLAPAHLPDHAVTWVRGEGFPMIRSMPGTRADGMVLRGASGEDEARLRYYEGGFDYGLSDLRAQTAQGDVAVQVFFPDDPAWMPGAPWSLEDWVHDWGALTLLAAEEAMGQFGRWSPDEMSARWPQMCRRAASRLRAQARSGPPPMALGQVEVAARDLTHIGFYRTERWRLRHPRFDGTMTAELEREVFLTSEAVVVLPYDPVRDAVLLIEQFRPNVMAAGDPNPWVAEPVAGLMDPGETPEDTAHRETAEEAGLSLNALHSVGRAYSSTGSSTEFVHLFIGIADFSTRVGGGGLASEGEDIRGLEQPFAALMEDLGAGRVRDMPLIVTAQWLAMNRDKWRASA